MPRGPKAAAVDLAEGERAELERLLRRRGVGQALAQRIRIVLACAEPGATNLGVARALGVSRPTVATWRRRFAAHHLEGLTDAPRSGAPRTIGDAAVERLIALTLEEAPRNATHWSTRAMARRAGMSQTAVSRIWRAFGLRPHRSDSFKLSSDPAFVEKVRDTVGLYLAPPDRALVLCVDEMRSRRSRLRKARRRRSRCGPAKPSGARTITAATAPSTSSPRSTSGRVRWSVRASDGTAASSSAPSSIRSRAACHRVWRCTSCSTT
jgi:transposase